MEIFTTCGDGLEGFLKNFKIGILSQKAFGAILSVVPSNIQLLKKKKSPKSLSDFFENIDE
ncbi:hypothetical protein [Cognataquiflexum rubidum]|uniref:hypothetical protein n=1 Tax=Cognataquiflexum rubidum TaxID=2922273 RepID=UPI001F1326CB|nr:hypothetical protein [Cognataquiflexum rubidum]MCH6235057.1 hypothetical protein [Cognataquiflexum rubidum]